jgi:hypothetical protein
MSRYRTRPRHWLIVTAGIAAVIVLAALIAR